MEVEDLAIVEGLEGGREKGIEERVVETTERRNDSEVVEERKVSSRCDHELESDQENTSSVTHWTKREKG